MALKFLLISVTILAFVDYLAASPTRRQYIAITEETASDVPVTNDGTEWDDNDEFDLDGDGWFSQAVVSPSTAPDRAHDLNDYADDFSHGGNMMVDFDGDDDDDEDEEDDHQEQEAEEEEEGNKKDSEFLFAAPPKDSRLILEDDDDDQSGPIKVRHTGRSSYPRVADGSDNSIESTDEDNEHPYEFTIDEDDEDKEGASDDEEDDVPHREDDSVEVLPSRHEPLENDDDEDEFVSEGDDNDDMFDNPEEEAAQVIYGDHVFLY